MSTATQARLLRAVAANHRAWFRRGARAAGGRIERFGGIDLVVAGAGAAIPFPGSVAQLDAVVARIRSLGLTDVGCWSLGADPRLGTALVSRGFGWGWQPHWMARTLDAIPPPGTPARPVVAAQAPYARKLPYVSDDPDPPGTCHLGIRSRSGVTLGHVSVNPWRGVAGIYSMGVARRYRGRGIGLELTLAACRVAAARGCHHAVLNATDEGERVYRRAGFESLGRGQTWWLDGGPPPSARQTALAEAIGHGELERLAGLRPTPAELEQPLPGDTSPLRLAVVTGRAQVGAWLLGRAPGLAGRRFEPFGGTLLHLAVEWDQPDFIELGLAAGVDPAVRDGHFDATALGWAEHFGRTGLAARLAAAATPA